ncbi:UNVERIFIED_CONTAM: hypothetical protein GTU68_035296 [Idotea baltica]|nr:hypothetical protein [Idotea baltica]
MKYLVVGLGNVGKEYVGTRHNIGFEAVDAFVAAREGSHNIEKLGEVSRVKFRGRHVVLLKPNTFMNLSGKALKYWMDKESIPIDKVLVVVDDLNLDLGKMRVRAKGSSGGHNGLKDIETRLGKSVYPRLRIGIGDDFKKGQQVDFVLGSWEEDELEKLPAILDRTTKVIEAFVFRGLKDAMNAVGK